MTPPARDVLVEPLIPRPSTRGGRRPRPARRGWANPIGWVALAAACSAYFLLLLVGFTSLLGVLLLTVAMIALLPWLGRVGNGAVTYDPRRSVAFLSRAEAHRDPSPIQRT